jgi:2-polyprenyl-3-methyl-5-hydroxy-6-metoxy-1,4-benzoquinol methylase
MDDRERWNARYAARQRLEAGEPHPFLREHVGLLPRGEALELAMGEGQNAIFLAQQGFSVRGFDISAIAVERARQLAQRAGVKIDAQVVDLRAVALPRETYDVIVCFYYLQRDLWPHIVAALKPGGMVVYETFTIDQAQFGHPTNPDYLLRPNELLHAFRELRIRIYRDLIIPGPKAVASLIGEKVARRASPESAEIVAFAGK